MKATLTQQAAWAVRTWRGRLWLGSMLLALIAVLGWGPPMEARVALLLALPLWGFWGAKAQVLPPLLALLLLAAARLPVFPEQAASLWAVLLGLSALTLRCTRDEFWASMGSGLLWAGMLWLQPGLAPLVVLGLLGLAGIREPHPRAVFFSGLGVFAALLTFWLLRDQLPPALTAPVQAETYTALWTGAQDLFLSGRLVWLIPWVGLFELAQGHPQDLRRGMRHFFILGGLLALLFLPVDVQAGLVPAVGLPVSAWMLTRWCFALPPLRRLYPSKLHPPLHPLPDQLWLTWINALLAAGLLWWGWNQGLAAMRSGEPVHALESLLAAEGLGQPVAVWLQTLLAENDWGPQFWNRVLSFSFAVLSVGMFCRVVARQTGAVAAITGTVMMLAFPGWMLHLAGAGSGSLALWLFLLGYSAVQLEDQAIRWLRGGVCLGLACALMPVWVLPVAGLGIGTFELRRNRLPMIGAGFAAGLVIGAILWVISGATAHAALLLGLRAPPPEAHVGLTWIGLLRGYPFVAFLTVALMVQGFRRRGPGWWALLLSLPPALLANRLSFDPSQAWIPLVLFSIFAFLRAPALLDIRHPRLYQHAVTCQLLLWLPLVGGVFPNPIFP